MLVYTSDVLTEPVEVTGPVTADGRYSVANWDVCTSMGSWR